MNRLKELNDLLGVEFISEEAVRKHFFDMAPSIDSIINHVEVNDCTVGVELFIYGDENVIIYVWKKGEDLSCYGEAF